METEKNVAETYLDPVTKKFKEGNPGGGRKPMTDEQKVAKKAAKEIIKEYKEALAQALPLLEPVLVAKAVQGDIQAIKEIHDQAMGKAKETKELTVKLPEPILGGLTNAENKRTDSEV